MPNRIKKMESLWWLMSWSSFFVEIIIFYIYIKYLTRNKYYPFQIQIFIFQKNSKSDDKGGPLSNCSFF